MNVQVLGISIDHIPCLKAWAESLGGINYPLLSDFWPHGAVCRKYHVLREEGRSERAIFIVDPDGIIRYIDIHDIDDQPDNEVLLAELKKIIPAAEEKMAHLYDQAPAQPPASGVIMYCTPWCPDCRKAREWLSAQKIAFSEVDISRDLTSARQVRSWGNGYQITPAFDINGQIVLDFDIPKLEKNLLKK